MYSAFGVRAARMSPKCVRNSSIASRSGAFRRPYASSRTLITAIVVLLSSAAHETDGRGAGRDSQRSRHARLRPLMLRLLLLVLTLVGCQTFAPPPALD